jgi:hypothetical protein
MEHKYGPPLCRAGTYSYLCSKGKGIRRSNEWVSTNKKEDKEIKPEEGKKCQEQAGDTSPTVVVVQMLTADCRVGSGCKQGRLVKLLWPLNRGGVEKEKVHYRIKDKKE